MNYFEIFEPYTFRTDITDRISKVNAVVDLHGETAKHHVITALSK